jgi:hypothetical protein
MKTNQITPFPNALGGVLSLRAAEKKGWGWGMS